MSQASAVLSNPSVERVRGALARAGLQPDMRITAGTPVEAAA
jgi:hypothetical protein